MKKKLIASLCIFAMALSIFLTSVMESKAAEDGIVVDGSTLTKQEKSVGVTELAPRGIHLMDGECSITKSGIGRIYVYASTTADHEVDYISTVIYVDQYNKSTGIWEQIDCWQVEDRNTYYVQTSKTMRVDRGYYYRVHADHVAGMKAEYPYEECTSLTDGIWID